MIEIFNYKLFLLLILTNIFLFQFYRIVAKKTGLIDKSRKFKNPITVTSGGIVIYLNFLFLLIYNLNFNNNFINDLPNNFYYTFILFSILVFISALDDLNSIDPKIRLFFQLICVYFSLSSIEIYYLALPIKLSLIICLFVWVYILNITNFTDGSDGFLAINTIFLYLNIIFINEILNINLFSKYFAIILIPSIIVFLYFNKPNAKIYMGDSGSILIGLINGFIFLELLTKDYLNIAISLLIYPLLDCTIALYRKTLDKKLPWVDTSNYSFLQPAIKKSRNKFFVFYLNILFNIFNSLLMIMQILFGWYFILLNILLTVSVLLIYEKKN